MFQAENDFYTRTPTPLAHNEIINKLHALREHSLIDSSRFSVSAIVEIKIKDNSFAYVGGVNIENQEQNRLSMHAEQTALAIAQTLLGGNVRYSRIWLMGAPESIKNGSNHALADNPVMSCGHCRQILMSCSTDDAELVSVTVNGKIAVPVKLKDLLPQAFSERDLNLDGQLDANHASLSDVWAQNMEALLAESRMMGAAEILKYLRCITPHIISEDFKTSPIISCIIRLANPFCYIPGALVQDIGFLTTDAVFTAFGHAITRFGANKLNVSEIYFYSDSLLASQFRGSEIRYIRRFVNHDIPIYFFDRTGQHAVYQLSECIRESYLSLQFSAC